MSIRHRHQLHRILFIVISITILNVGYAFSTAPSSPVNDIRPAAALRQQHIQPVPTGTPVAFLQASSTTVNNDSKDAAKEEDDDDDDDDKMLTILDDALKFNRSSASFILEKVQTIRSTESQEEVDNFLDTILSYVDGDGGDGKMGKLPFWTRFRPIARVSSRARRASLGRVLDLTTPSLDETDDNNNNDDDDEASKIRSRRRSLVVLLRTLAASEEEDENIRGRNNNSRIPSICKVEKKARREAREGATFEDMTTRLPPGLETPDYSILSRRPTKKGAFEIRKYKAYSKCTVPMNKPRPSDAASRTDAKISNPQLSGASSFGALAGYLFGKNSDSTAMKMTTPVLTVGEGEEKTMSFVMPSDYWDELGVDRAPKPLEGSGVMLERDDGGYRAAVMFGGYASKAEIERRKVQLVGGIDKDKEFDVVEGAPISLAQYNDPFTPPWKRRNEVFVPVVPRNE